MFLFYLTKSQILKPIFHQNAKYLASGTFASPNAKNSTSASPNARIPTCWYLKCENLRFPTPNLKFALAPTPNPDASQWNIGCVGSQREISFAFGTQREPNFRWNMGLKFPNLCGKTKNNLFTFARFIILFVTLNTIGSYNYKSVLSNRILFLRL